MLDAMNSRANKLSVNTLENDAMQNDKEVALALSGIGYRLDDKPLLSDIDLTIYKGSTTAIMGYNGAGKSLLLRIMHGILAPSCGKLILGVSTASRTDEPRQAMVFQKPVLLRRTVKANILFALPTSVENKSKACDSLLNMVGLSEHASKPARRLSGGEQQRLVMARALAIDPEILFLDEATAALDPASAILIENLVQQQKAKGTTSLLVTHDAAQAQRLSDQVIFVHNGNIVEQANTIDFFNSPGTAEAKAYLSGKLLAN